MQSGEEKVELTNLLYEYQNIFLENLGCTKHIYTKLKLSTTLYPIPYKYQACERGNK